MFKKTIKTFCRDDKKIKLNTSGMFTVLLAIIDRTKMKFKVNWKSRHVVFNKNVSDKNCVSTDAVFVEGSALNGTLSLINANLDQPALIYLALIIVTWKCS